MGEISREILRYIRHGRLLQFVYDFCADVGQGAKNKVDSKGGCSDCNLHSLECQ